MHHAAEPLTYEVHRGDYLGAIAERFEGDFGAYTQIAHDNHIKNPDVIHPGRILTLPGDAVDLGSMPHASGAVMSGSTATDNTPAAGSGGGPAQTKGGSHSTVKHSVHRVVHTLPSPTQPPTAPTAVTPTHQPTEAPRPTHVASHAPAPVPNTHTVTPHTPGHTQKPIDQKASVPSAPNSSAFFSDVLEASGTLAAVISLSLFAVQKRELLQRRFVKRAGPASGGAVPRLMVPTRQQDVIRLDASLRALAAIVDGWPVERIPQIAGVWMDYATMTLLLADDCGSAPDPFIDDPNGWQLPLGAELPAFDTQLAPLPTMCTVGGRANQHLLLDIEYLRVLGIGGDAVGAVNLLRFIAVELVAQHLVRRRTHRVGGFRRRIPGAGGDRPAADARRAVDSGGDRRVP